MRRGTALALVFAAVFATTALGIFNGVDSTMECVLALGRWGDDKAIVTENVMINDTPVPLPLLATGNVIDYRGIDQRCVLTAKHMVPCRRDVNPPCDGGDARWHRAVLEQNAVKLDPEDRDQLVAKTGAVMPGSDRFDTYRDLRINWLQYVRSSSTDRKIELSDYVAEPIAPAPLHLLPSPFGPPEDDDYDIRGYGRNGSPDTGLGERRWGDPTLDKLEVRTWGDKGARLQTRPGSGPKHRSECFGDSGAGIDVNSTFFSAVSAGSKQDCDPAGRDPYFDPNPPPPPPPPPGPVTEVPEPPKLPGEVVLHSILNSDGAVAQPPANSDWKEVGNWEQIEYLISEVCTKHLNVSISGAGQVLGTLDTPLNGYDTQDLNHQVDCWGNGSLLSSIGDCVEAIHQPESILLHAIPADDWQFVAWEPPFQATTDDGQVAPDDCPCAGSGPSCLVEFDDVGRYTTEISYDVSSCVARFQEIPQQGTCTTPPCPIPVG